MKLKSDEREVLTGGALKEHAFGINDGDMHVVFDILRSKLYKDPIGSICREIASNGRDSHREAGTPDLPIEVEMRDSKDSIFYDDGLNIIFRDFGVGLSPERVEGVYSKYGSSTKRDSNTQTGGFGLGAKTPFAYKDGFSVRTIYNGTEYGYSVIIDESKRGSIVLLLERPAPEGHVGNLTEVIVPVDKADAKLFEESLVKATHFWPIRPRLIGFKHESYTEIQPPSKVSVTAEEPGVWRLYQAPGVWGSGFIESSVNAIIDGIYYPVDTKLLKGDLAGASICMYFENGELTVSANREQLQYDDRTKEVLLDRLSEALNKMRAEYDAKISKQPMFLKALEAHRYAEQHDPLYKSLVAYAGPPTWTSPSGVVRAMDGVWALEAHTVSVVTDTGNRAKYEVLGRLDTHSVAARADAIYILEAGAKVAPGANRTLFNKHKGGFVLIKQNEPDPEKPDRAYYAKLTGDAEKVDDLGIVPVDISTIQATRAERMAKQTITLRTPTGSDNTVHRVEYLVEEDGRVTRGGQERSLVVMYVESEKTFGDEQKTRANYLYEMVAALMPKATLVVASESKRRLLGGQTSVEDMLEAKRPKVVQYCLRYALGTQVADAAKFDGFTLPPDIEAAIKPLRDLRSIPWLRGIGYLTKTLKDGGYYPVTMPDYTAALGQARGLYPLLEKVETAHRREYVKAMNELHELRREKAARETPQLAVA